MGDVPSDILQEILLRSPAESLFRLRSVCKSWLRIIHDPSFIKAHANYNQLYSHTIFVRNRSGTRLYSFCLDSLNFKIKGPQMIDATRIKNVIRPGVPIFQGLLYVASCNGLILIFYINNRRNWVIRNPLTKGSHKLPKPAAKTTYYFGYDSVSDDYKVVRIDTIDHKNKVVYQTLIYSLKSDSWRRVEDSPSSVRFKAAFFDGALYWTSKDAIIALDLRTERFFQLPLPQIIDYRFGFHIDALDGCLIYTLDNCNQETFDGWVMNDNGVEKQWIRLFSLPKSVFYANLRFRLVAYLKIKKQVLLYHSHYFFLFDIGNNSIKKLSIHGLDIASCLICPGSLVRRNDYHRTESGFGAVTATPTLLGKRKKKTRMKTKRTRTRLKVCVRNTGEMCCSDNHFCGGDSCWHCKEEQNWEEALNRCMIKVFK